MPYTAPLTVSASDTITAELWNTYVRDNTLAAAVWTSFTPTWTAPTSPSLGNGTLTGAYLRAGDLITVQIVLTWGSTTNGGAGAWAIGGLPFASDGLCTLPAMLLDNGEAWYGGYAWVPSGGASSGFVAAGAVPVATSTPFTWAAGDRLMINGSYRKG